MSSFSTKDKKIRVFALDNNYGFITKSRKDIMVIKLKNYQQVRSLLHGY